MRKVLDKLNNIFYINNEIYTHRKDIRMSDTTTYIIKGIKGIKYQYQFHNTHTV